MLQEALFSPFSSARTFGFNEESEACGNQQSNHVLLKLVLYHVTMHESECICFFYGCLPK